MGIILVTREETEKDFQSISKYITHGISTNEALHFYDVTSALNFPHDAFHVIFFNADGYTEPEGIHIITQLAQHYIQVPIIVIRGTDNHLEEKQYTDAGAQDVLVREFTTAYTLTKAVQYAVERKLLTGKLNNVQPDYYKYFHENPVPMLLYERETLQYIDVNNAAIETYGYSREEFLQMTVLDVRPKDDKQYLLDVLNNWDASKGFFDFGYWLHQKKDGTQLTVHIFCHGTEFNGRQVNMVMCVDETIRIETEKKNNKLNRIVRQQKEQLENILLSINEVIWSMDAESMRYTYISEACRGLYGFSQEEIMNTKDFTLSRIHPDDVKKYINAKEVLCATGEVTVEYRVFHKSGNIRHIMNQAVLQKDDRSIHGAALDITHIREMEQELEVRKKEVVHILESITEGFVALDHKGCFTNINKEFEKLFDRRREDLLGHFIWEVFPEAKQYFELEHIEAAIAHQASKFEMYYPPLEKWFFIKTTPTSNGLVVFFMDITEEKTLHGKILRNEQNFRSLINNTSDLIWSIDRNYCIVSANDLFVQVMEIALGITFKPNDNILDCRYGKEEIQRWKEAYDKVFSTGEHHLFTLHINYIPNVEYIETSLNPIKDEHGNIVGISCYSHDITQQKKYLTKIEAQNKVLTDIAWVQSHKVRRPVATILGLEQLFNYEEAHDPFNKEILKGIKTMIEELDVVIKDTVANINAIDFS